MIDSEDVSEEELEVLKGDAVGDTLCSSKWIITTLMSLCQIDKNGWTDELEDQLCTLWDLSTEAEVVSHLMSNDFLKIAKNTLMISDEPRLTEIVLGIIGNVCCNDEAIDLAGDDKELVTQILSRIVSDDSLILIQLIRISQLIAWRIRQNPESNWVAHLTECEFFGDSVTFILKSSTNDELLISTMNLLESISQINHENNFLEKLFKVDNLIPALLESFMQVIREGKTSYSELTFVQHWLAVLIAIMESGSLKFEDDYENDEKFSKLMNIMYIILKPCTKSYNLYPIRQLSANMIYDAVRVLLGFHRCNINVPPRLDRIVAILIFSLKTVLEAKAGKDLDPEELKTDLLDYLIKYWLHIIELCTSEQIVEILRLCERKVRDCLMKLMQFDCKIDACKMTIEKVKKAVAALEDEES